MINFLDVDFIPFIFAIFSLPHEGYEKIYLIYRLVRYDAPVIQGFSLNYLVPGHTRQRYTKQETTTHSRTGLPTAAF